jgi:hypothetical protein
MNYYDDFNIKKDEIGLAAHMKQITKHTNLKAENLFGKIKA